MQLTVKFLGIYYKRDFKTDNLECQFKFSTIDSSLIGTPRDIGSVHKLKLIMDDRLIVNWNLVVDGYSEITENMIKVAYQRAEEYIKELLRKSITLEDEVPTLFMMMENEPNHCPYNLSNITYPPKDTFIVNLDDQKDTVTLKACLEDYAYFLQSKVRMSFWRYDEKKKPIWISSPEKLAKNLLHASLVSKYGSESLTFEEIPAGAGRIDIFIIMSEGEKAVIELKMCGHGYNASYAQEGYDQLKHYMPNQKSYIGFLIVLDARERDFKKGFIDNQIIDGLNITTIIADLRPHVKDKDSTDDV
jgi:hypothetical protein